VASRNTQYSSETPTQQHRELWRGGKAGLVAPCTLCVQRGEGYTCSKESLNKTADAGGVDVEGEAGEEEWSSESTSAEFLGYGADEAVNLV